MANNFVTTVTTVERVTFSRGVSHIEEGTNFPTELKRGRRIATSFLFSRGERLFNVCKREEADNQNVRSFFIKRFSPREEIKKIRGTTGGNEIRWFEENECLQTLLEEF